MERTRILDTMSGLKLYGMRSAYDEIAAAASASIATVRRRSPEGRDLEAGALNQYQYSPSTSAGQGRRRLRVQQY